MQPLDDIREYYATRAEEYDRVYEIPERQADLERLREVLVAFGVGRRVLEIACGTGYWTAMVAPAAASVLATDVVEEVLAVARRRDLSGRRVTFARWDALALESLPGSFDAAFAGFWLSHLRRSEIAGFLAKLHARLGAGTAVLLFDNMFVPGSSTPISRTDDEGNSYQERVLADGARYEVLKNFLPAAAIRQQLADVGASAIHIETLQYYWYATYQVGGGAQLTP